MLQKENTELIITSIIFIATDKIFEKKIEIFKYAVFF